MSDWSLITSALEDACKAALENKLKIIVWLIAVTRIIDNVHAWASKCCVWFEEMRNICIFAKSCAILHCLNACHGPVIFHVEKKIKVHINYPTYKCTSKIKTRPNLWLTTFWSIMVRVTITFWQHFQEA